VFVRHRTRAARLYCFSVPTIVTRTLLFATLTSALHLFFSNIQTQQLIHNLNIPHTKYKHAAIKYSNSWITWVLGKLMCRRYYGSCAVGIAEAVPSVLRKLCRRYCGSCAVGIAEAVLSVLQKLYCRYYRSSHNNTSNAFQLKCQNDTCTYTKSHVKLSFNSGFVIL